MRKRFLVAAVAAGATFAIAFGAYAGIAKVTSAAAVTPLPRSSCGPVQSMGTPDFIVASDLPLQGSSRTQTIEMTKAIAFIFGQKGYKAGKYSFGYQSCDDSTAQAGKWDPAKCSANAGTYSRNKSVIAVIGTFNSGCAEIEVPIANRASLGYVSPANTYIGLTHGPALAGEPDKYYPTHKRNYVRVVAADDFQGAADVLATKAAGKTKVYVLNDKEAYGFGIASAFKNVAKAGGLTVVGFEAWDPKASSYADLATKIKNSGAEAVFLGGLECENGGKLIKDLRAGLGTGVLLVAPDGFSSFSDTISHAGAGAAEGMLISIAGQPYANLGADGKAFANAFGKAVLKKPGNAVNPYSNYGATAALTVISALAGSNGTRASFTANLFKTNFKSSPIGAFKLNANGDTNAGVISFYKVTGGKANFEKIISPPASLVAQAKP